VSTEEQQTQSELIPMSLGDLLLQARTKQGLSLETASRAVRIKPDVLAAIEAGRTEHVPSVYLKGYIRSYARYLGLPQTAVEKSVRTARGADPVIESVFNVAPPRTPSDRWFKATSYVLASAVVLALVWQFTAEAVRFSQGDPLLRPARNGEMQVATQASNTETGSAAPAEPAKRLPNTHLRASIASMNTDAEFVEVGLPSAAEGAWAAVSNRNAVAPAAGATGTLEIVTSADSWVEILGSNGEKIEMDLLRAGSRRSYNAAPPVRLLLGRASSVELFHNGEKIDLGPYTRGNVARLTLSPEDPGTEPAASTVTTTKDEPLPDQG
jgi:cytoskeleton protein RodZ